MLSPLAERGSGQCLARAGNRNRHTDILLRSSPRVNPGQGVAPLIRGAAMAKPVEKETEDQQGVSFVAYITLRDGRVIWARDYGLRGFPIRRAGS